MEPQPLEVRLVVFDWAGTTVDFGSLAPAGAFVRAFAAKGVGVTLPEARRPMGLHKKDHLREMLRDAAVADRWQVTHGRAWAEPDVDELYRLVTPMQVEAARQHGALTPGVIECVVELRRQGIKVAASTGYFREAAEACYTAAREQGYVPDYTVCADEVSAGRPAPWMVFRCMEATGVFPPSAVVTVGDTLVDIQAGVNAGAWSIGVVDSGNLIGLSADDWAALPDDEKEDRRADARQTFFDAGADGVVDTLAELPGLIEELNGILAERESSE